MIDVAALSVITAASLWLWVGWFLSHAEPFPTWSTVVFWPIVLKDIIIEHRRKKIRGRDRQSQANHQDPKDNPFTFTLNPGAGYAAKSAQARADELIRAATMPSGYSPNFNVGTWHAETPPAPKLEEVSSDMPIMATRYAKLAFFSYKPPRLKSVAGYGEFDVEADAVCQKQDSFNPSSLYSLARYGSETSLLRALEKASKHPAPHPDCKCGFYAVPADKLPKHDHYKANAKLLVELSGTVIEHDEGYRAEHQRVLEVQLAPCLVCGADAERLIVSLNNSDHPVRFVDCGAHAHTFADCVEWDVANLARGLGVPVTTRRD